MADGRTPGPQCSLRNPVNIKDGTLCRQPSPRPGVLGYWDSFEFGVGSTFISVTDGASYLLDTGVSFAEAEYALAGRYSQAALDEAKELLLKLVAKIKNAADWQTLNRLARPILGPTSFQFGVLYGVGESLSHDVIDLLSMAKMIVLAGLYERIKHKGLAMFLDPMMTPLALAVDMIPGMDAEMKKADEQLWKMLHELEEIVKHPLNFLEAIGKSIKKDALDDWNKLKEYSEHPTVTNDFQAGRIFGRVLYQVIMLILLVLSVAGAVAKLAARFPWLLRVTRILKAGGELEELEEAQKIEQTARAAEDAAAAEREAAARAAAERDAAKKPDLSTNAKKGVFGEAKADAYMKNEGFTKMNGPDVQVGDSPKGNGIDGIYKNSSPPPEYVIGETKFGSSQLGTLKDGTKQMSDKWIDDRLNSELGRADADAVRDAIARGQTEKWLLNVDDAGNVTKTVLK